MSAPSRNHRRRLRSPYLAGLQGAGYGLPLCFVPVRLTARACLLRLAFLAAFLVRRSWPSLRPWPRRLLRRRRRIGDPAARGFDRRLGALGHADAAHAHLARSSPVLITRRLAHGSRRCPPPSAPASRSRPPASFASSRQAHFRRVVLRQRHEAALRQAPLQRHLAAFEADLVEAAGARFLALVAAAGGLAQPEPMPRPTRRAAFLLPAAGLIVFSRMVAISAWRSWSSTRAQATFTRYATLLIMPRTAGVSSTSTVWCVHLRPRPRTVAR